MAAAEGTRGPSEGRWQTDATIALERLVRWMADKHGLAVALSVEPDAPAGAGDVRVLLYEAVRELLFNVVKHSGVKTSRVEISKQDEYVVVTVADDGAGFDPARLNPGENSTVGFGLHSLRERFHVIGGKMEIDSAPGKGSRFRLMVPLTTAISKLPQ